MPTPPDPNGRPPTAHDAAADPSSAAPRPGSTGSHRHDRPSSVPGAPKRPSVESDIAQFLAHPTATAGNTDDAPTVITKGSAGTAPPVPLPVIVTTDAPSIAGRKLGHYELIEAIGAGGMAAVLKARDTELGRVVALKILPPEAARDPESVTRFKQEGRAAAALDHDNVARVYFCGEDQGLHFIAFEFVEGINLRQMIDRRGVLPAGECVRYMMQVAAGLNHAAERGVVHRDIKPSNILITPDGRAKIVDMGLARQLDAELVNGAVTQSGVTLGTFDYISPEQALDPRRADARSDIYSLGCTFYHALTGRPPVPEGTAAKKLRAHQNDAPLDPRELNPAIPDELAAVLGRMMAKDPGARYQTPTDLIAHLKGLAERLKIGGDALAHDSATKSVPAELRLLPEAPRVRAAWVLAAVAVAAAVVAFVIATSNPGPAPGAPGDPSKTKAPDFTDKGLPPLPPDPPPGPKRSPDGPVRTVEQLVQKLEDPATTRVVLAPGEYDLTKLPGATAFAGKELELVGAPGGGSRLVLSANEKRGAAGSLALRADAVTLRNLRIDFALDANVTVEDDGVTKPVGLRIDDAAKVEFVDCVVTTDGRCASHDTRAVAVGRAEGAPAVSALRCVFAPGWIGFAVPAGAQVALTDCGFAPHSAVVYLEPGGPDAPVAAVRLDRCAFMLDPGAAAVEAGATARAAVEAGDCVFAPANGTTVRSPFPSAGSDSYRRGVVLRLRTDKAAGAQFAPATGRTNAYYRTDPLGTRQTTLTFEDCRTDAPMVEDKAHADLKQRPWAEADPVAALGAEAKVWRAFALKIDTDADLFTKDRKSVPMGAAFHNPADNTRRAYADLAFAWPPPRPRSAEEARTKVWWPNARDEDLVPGTYNDPGALLKSARPDDIIVIRHTGELPVDNIELKAPTKPSEGEFKITFRPEKGSRPVLVVQGDNDRDQTLFKLKAGEVTFEGLHFRLRPNLPKNGQIVAAVGITGGKACAFRNCAFTLAEDDDSKVAAVHLPDIDKVMAMDPALRPVPKVTFANCLVRGKGRAVWAEVSRPVNLDVADCVTALDGPVLYAEAGGKVAAGAGSTALLVRTTVLAGGPVVEMRGGKAGDPKAAALTPLQLYAEDCLFVAVPGAGRPLVELEGVDPTDVKAVLKWEAKKPNRYAGFDTAAALAQIQPAGDGAPKVWTRDDWIGNTNEPPGADKRFGAVTFAGPISGLKDLAAVKPADARAKTVDFPDLSDPKDLEAGASAGKLKDLPPLVEEMKD